MSESVPGLPARLFGLIAAILVVSELMTQITGTYWHWLFALAGIIVGLMAVKSILR